MEAQNAQLKAKPAHRIYRITDSVYINNPYYTGRFCHGTPSRRANKIIAAQRQKTPHLQCSVLPSAALKRVQAMWINIIIQRVKTAASVSGYMELKDMGTSDY